MRYHHHRLPLLHLLHDCEQPAVVLHVEIGIRIIKRTSMDDPPATAPW